MPKASPFFVTTASFLVLSLSAMATDMEHEYAEVRKIALKDPKVQAAYEKADERLNQRILEIDPSLKPLVERQSAHPQGPAQRTDHYATAPVAPRPSGHEHVVVKGETLTSIADHYHVTVKALESANHIGDENKLHVGQKLVIPISEKAASMTPKTTKDENFWNELKKEL